MSLAFLLPLANQPLFGNQWLALFAILGGVAGFVSLIITAGRWLAATHPEPALPPAPASAGPSATPAPAPAAPDASTIPADVLAVIAAAVATTVGPRARIAAVEPVRPSIEMLMAQWSVEGRRQIYSSHQIR